MNGRLHIQPPENQEEERRCVSCGAPLQATPSSNRAWSLESLLPAGIKIGSDQCPACRQRYTALRIGAVVSARL
jgi:Zn ribbon nucleic-acid-binding protein